MLKNVKKSKEKLTKNPCDKFRVKENVAGNAIVDYSNQRSM